MEKQFYNFVKEVYDKQLGVEGIAIADGEKILMEHHFTPDQARNIYSHTKSYMSTAVGRSEEHTSELQSLRLSRMPSSA